MPTIRDQIGALNPNSPLSSAQKAQVAYELEEELAGAEDLSPAEASIVAERLTGLAEMETDPDVRNAEIAAAEEVTAEAGRDRKDDNGPANDDDDPDGGDDQPDIAGGTVEDCQSLPANKKRDRKRDDADADGPQHPAPHAAELVYTEDCV